VRCRGRGVDARLTSRPEPFQLDSRVLQRGAVARPRHHRLDIAERE